MQPPVDPLPLHLSGHPAHVALDIEEPELAPHSPEPAFVSHPVGAQGRDPGGPLDSDVVDAGDANLASEPFLPVASMRMIGDAGALLGLGVSRPPAVLL